MIDLLRESVAPGRTRLVANLGFRTPPLSLNGRENRYVANSARQALKHRVKRLCAKWPPIDRAHAGIVWLVADNRRRDPDNLAATLKPALDGLVIAGVLVDDTHLYVPRTWQEIRKTPDQHGLYLILEEVGEQK